MSDTPEHPYLSVQLYGTFEPEDVEKIRTLLDGMVGHNVQFKTRLREDSDYVYAQIRGAQLYAEEKARGERMADGYAEGGLAV